MGMGGGSPPGMQDFHSHYGPPPFTAQSHRYHPIETSPGNVFDIFALFDILDREYNIHAADYDADTYNTPSSSSEEESYSELSSRLPPDDGDEQATKPTGAQPVLPDSNFSINAPEDAEVIRVDSRPKKKVVLHSDDESSQTFPTFDWRITYNKLKADLVAMIDTTMDEFELKLDENANALKTKYRKKLKKHTKLKIKHSFERLFGEYVKDSPGTLRRQRSWSGIPPLSSSFSDMASSFKESPF